MKDLSEMTPAELDEWHATEIARARERFAGQPLPDIDRRKAADYPQFEQVGWSHAVYPGAPAVLRRPGAQVDEHVIVLGLRHVADAGPLALVVRLNDATTWALRRHDGTAAWAERPTHRWANAARLRLPVTAWASPNPDDVPAPHDQQDWLFQSANLEQEPHR